MSAVDDNMYAKKRDLLIKVAKALVLTARFTEDSLETIQEIIIAEWKKENPEYQPPRQGLTTSDLNHHMRDV